MALEQPNESNLIAAASNPPQDQTRPPLRTLFPDIEPYSSGYLAVDAPHQIYWEQSGNPDGAPIVLLHGGPGAGAGPKHRRYFDPAHYRIVIFDQRGAGRSTPSACTDANTLPDLVADMECLRQHLNIDRWHVFGGSWGSTLALTYATQHPDRVRSLTLRGIFLYEPAEIDWFTNGMGLFFPEAYDALITPLSEDERKDVLASYQARLTHPDRTVQMNAAQVWCGYESACASLIPGPPALPLTEEDRAYMLALARIEAHYFKICPFSDGEGLLTRASALTNIPGTIVHGRYDVVCPVANAWKLHKVWPNSRLVIVPDGGHSASDPAVLDALITATEDAKRF